jgi:hypothetical protein
MAFPLQSDARSAPDVSYSLSVDTGKGSNGAVGGNYSQDVVTSREVFAFRGSNLRNDGTASCRHKTQKPHKSETASATYFKKLSFPLENANTGLAKGRRRSRSTARAGVARRRDVEMRQPILGAFDPDTIAVLLQALDEASAALKADEAIRQRLARLILIAARDGERDPERLREHALGGLNA